jgi:hypothetical protein
MCPGRDKPLLEDDDDDDSKNFAHCGPLRKYNHNAVVNWALKGSAGAADSVWSNTVLAAYLYELVTRWANRTPTAFIHFIHALHSYAQRCPLH